MGEESVTTLKKSSQRFFAWLRTTTLKNPMQRNVGSAENAGENFSKKKAAKPAAEYAWTQI